MSKGSNRRPKIITENKVYKNKNKIAGKQNMSREEANKQCHSVPACKSVVCNKKNKDCYISSNNMFSVKDKDLRSKSGASIKSYAFFAGSNPAFNSGEKYYGTVDRTANSGLLCNNWPSGHFDQKKLNVLSLVQVRANLVLKSEDTIECGYHIDYNSNKTTTGILFLTGCNAKTVLKIDKDEIPIDNKENRMLLFNTSISAFFFNSLYNFLS